MLRTWVTEDGQTEQGFSIHMDCSAVAFKNSNRKNNNNKKKHTHKKHGYKSNRNAMNKNWSNQKANPALKTKSGNK